MRLSMTKKTHGFEVLVDWLDTVLAFVIGGCGLSDRFAGNYGPLQDEIEGLTIYTEVGGHKWTTWSNLWTRMMSDISQREK